MKLVFAFFVATFSLGLAHAQTTLTPRIPAIKAIAEDIDGLASDTVNESEWSASVRHKRGSGYPVATCQVKSAKRGKIYICELEFVIKPYSKDINDGKPWGATCSNMVYLVTDEENPHLDVERLRGIDECIESLNESP